MIAIMERTWAPVDYGERLDRVIEWMLVGLLAFMPLAFGAVQAWSEEVVIALAVVMAGCFCLRLIAAPDTTVTWTWAYLPIAAFILVAVVQIVPLPVSLVRLISPQTVVRKMELLGALDGSKGSPSSTTISFYIHATKHDLRLLLAVASVFFVAFNTVRRPDQIARLLAAVAIIGGAIAVLAIAQATFGNGKLYWFVPTPHDIAISGPFVNHSHFAQFMNLSVGAALGLILMRLHHAFRGRPLTPARVAEYLGSHEGKVLLILMLMVVVGITSIFISLSRGGMISTMIAGAFTVLVVGLTRSMRGSGWILAVLTLGAFICVLYVGFDAVYERLGTLSDVEQAEAGRWQIVQDLALAWTRFPLLGTGLGTHEVVYPMFDRATVPAIATHAENEYAQAAEETGLAGLISLAAWLILVWSAYVRTVRKIRAPVHSAVYGLGFGLLAVMVHSLSDFGQHLPANAILSTVSCALILRLATAGPKSAAMIEPDAVRTGARRRGTIALGLFCVLSIPVLLAADASRRAEFHREESRKAESTIAERDWQASDEEYRRLLSHAEQAVACQPANAMYLYALNVYRWHVVRSRVTDPNTGEIDLPPEGLAIAQRIVAEMKRAIPLCPTYGALWTVAGQLERFVTPESPVGAEYILTGRRLAACDPTACFVAGLLYADQGDMGKAIQELERTAELDDQWFSDVANTLVRTLRQPDLAYRLANHDADRLDRLESILRSSGENAELVQKVGYEVLELLEQASKRSNVTGWELARLAGKYRQFGRWEEAVQTYRRALTMQYERVSWRYSLAELLGERGFGSEAVRELEVCLRLQPKFPAAQMLMDKLLLQGRSRPDRP